MSNPRELTRRSPLQPFFGPGARGLVQLIGAVLLFGVALGGVGAALRQFGLSDERHAADVATPLALVVVAVVVAMLFLRWHRRGTLILGFGDTDLSIGGVVTEAIPYSRLRSIQVIRTPGLEEVRLQAASGRSFVFPANAWHLEAVVHELLERAVPILVGEARRKLGEGAVLRFRQARMWAGLRVLAAVLLSPFAIFGLFTATPGSPARVLRLISTVRVLFARNVVLSATGLRRSTRAARDTATWEQVSRVSFEAYGITVEAGRERFWLSGSAENALVFVALLRSFAPPGPMRRWATSS